MSLFGGITLPGKPDLANIQRLDLLPMHSIMEMMRFGMAIDIPHLQQVSADLAVELNDLRNDICSFIPPEKLDEFVGGSINVDSTQQLAELLFDTLGVGEGKQLKRTKSGSRVSTGRRQLEKLRSDHPVIPKILAYRERSKLKGISDGLPTQAVKHLHGRCCGICGADHSHDTDRIHTQILTTRTGTGRYASKNPNLQNVPIRSEWGRAIRAAFVAGGGKVLVSCDFSQIELRMLAWVGNVLRMLKAFKDDKDIHTTTAMDAFDISEDEVLADKIRYRNPSKNVNFAVVFRESALGLFEQLVADSYGKAGVPVPDWLTVEWCEDFLHKWFELYPEVKVWMDDQDYRAYRYGMVWDLFGRIRRIPEVRSCHPRIVAAGLRQGGNMPIQGLAAELMKLAIAEVQLWIETEIRPQGVHCVPLMTVHDEMLVEVDEDWGDVVKEGMELIFSNVLVDRDTWRCVCPIPIKAEGQVMTRWTKG